MKKLLALLLSLMLLLPAVSFAEAAESVDVYPVEFDDFILYVTSYDIIQKAAAKEEGQLLFMLYPAYDDASLTHPNINGVWTAQDLAAALDDLDAAAFAQDVIDESVQGLTAQGIIATNPQLISAEKVDGIMVLAYSMDMDYSGAGVDLQATIYQMQFYIGLGEKGSYVFTLSAYNADDLIALSEYVEAIEFKE